jgi:hypothetical protein
MANLGLLAYKSAGELGAEQEQQRQEQEQQRRQRMVESSLAAHIRRNFEAAKQSKREIEKRLLDCARRQKGVYDEEKLAAIRSVGGSEVYPKLTTTKCRAAAAWIRDILMPDNGEMPWGLDPTPVSDIPPEYIERFIQQLGEKAQDMDERQIREKLKAMIQEKAHEIADNHENYIKDQLTEGGWADALESFIDDFAVFPTAFLRGPVLQKVTELAWMEGWQPVEVEAVKPMFARVSPFDMYPSSDSSSIDDGAYLIERERFHRSDINAMRGVPGYSDEAVEAVLREHGQGGLRQWLQTDSERARLEDKPHDWIHNHGGLIEGLHYWGSAQGLMLLQWGMDPQEIDDPLAEYEIDAILIGQHVIRSVINRNPMGKRPYNAASYQTIPGSLWGSAIPELMEDIQDTCCAVARAQNNNLSFASGPQVEVNVDRLAPGEDPNEMFPLKRWRTISDRTTNGAETPAIRFFQPDSRAGELMSVYENWERRADDATNIPRYAYGNERVGGAGSTMGGLSMLMESANKGIKDAIRHIDRGVTRRVIDSLWLFNMRHSDNNAIKGDCKAVPRGASAMLLREQTQQYRQQFLASTTNEIDMQILGIEGRAKLLRKIANTLDMPGLIPDEAELLERQQQKEEQQKQQMEQQNQQMQTALEMEQAKQQNEQQKTQNDTVKAQASAAHDKSEAGKTDAETQRIMLEIQSLLSQLQGGTNAPY